MHADLHFHTTCSDGKHSVDWVVENLQRQKDHGLGLAVLTDHDGVDGFSNFSKSLKDFWTPVRACELSCMFRISDKSDQELHLLIFGIEDEDDFLYPIFEKFRTDRETRFLKICEKLGAAGYKVDAEGMVKKHPGRLGRPHVADALVEAGYASNRKEAFDNFLFKGSPYLVSKWRVDIEDVLRHTSRRGYPTSIAHPGPYSLGRAELERLKEMGLSAVEVFHPRHSVEDEKKYLGFARELELFVSGGSDFHDASSDHIGGQPSLGQTKYPLEMAENFLRDIL